jgi:hypothetical protein
MGTESVSALAQAYIEGLGACAVYVVGSDLHDLAQFGFSNEPTRTLAKIERTTSVQPLQSDLFFVLSEDAARLLCAALDDVMRARAEKKSGRWWGTKVGTLAETLVATAQTNGVALLTRASIEVRAEIVARQVSDQIEAMRRAGQLHQVNQQYKVHRASAPKPMSYPAWLQKYAAQLVRAIAEQARSGRLISLPGGT